MMDVVIVNIISFMVIIISYVILVNLYNFISGIGYCPFLSFLSNSPPQPAQPGHFGNFGAMAFILQKSVFNLYSRDYSSFGITMVIINIQHDYHDHYHRQVLIFSALTYMSEKEIASTSFTSVIDAFW